MVIYLILLFIINVDVVLHHLYCYLYVIHLFSYCCFQRLCFYAYMSYVQCLLGLTFVSSLKNLCLLFIILNDFIYCDDLCCWIESNILLFVLYFVFLFLWYSFLTIILLKFLMHFDSFVCVFFNVVLFTILVFIQKTTQYKAKQSALILYNIPKYSIVNLHDMVSYILHLHLL